MLDKNRPYDWYGNTVSTLLERPEYMGHTVNFRSSKKSYRDKRVKNAPEDWLIFENTHEAIVDPETWKLAQQIKRTVRRTDTTGVANPFTGLVFCADCGAKMYNHRGIRKTANGKEYPSDFYNCSTYALTIERETKQCFSHNVSTRALTDLVLETIRTTAGYALANRKAFIQKVRSISQVRQQEAAKELSRRVAKSKKRIAELDILMKKLYETYALGRMDEKRFELLSAGYEKEQDELEQALAADQANLDQFNEDTDRADKFLALAKKYTDFSELTPAMLNEFVEKIMVHAPDRSAGERVQEIEIYLKFIGKFDVPLPEPTPEELAAEEVRRQRRARDHCGRRSASARLPRGRSCRANRMRLCASAAGRASNPSAPTPSSVRPPAASGFTASKSGSFRRRMQYPSRNLQKQAKSHNTEHSGLPDEGRPLFLCLNMEVRF